MRNKQENKKLFKDRTIFSPGVDEVETLECLSQEFRSPGVDEVETLECLSQEFRSPGVDEVETLECLC